MTKSFSSSSKQNFLSDRKISKVISLDPGETTGVCIAKLLPDGNWDISTKALNQEQLYIFLETEPNVDLVIYETYKLYESKAKAMVNNEFITVQIIGVIKYIYSRRNTPVIKSQTSDKAFWSDQRLRYMNLYTKVEHERDAVRHFLNWLYFIEKSASIKDLVFTHKHNR
jgi:hypothetical protein